MADLTLLGAPLAVGIASLTAGAQRASRRRRALNAAIHEIRRPLQAMTLAPEMARVPQLGLAIDAVHALERELNGGPPPACETVDGARLAREAAARWQVATAHAGRVLVLSWRAGRCAIRCDPAAIARAIDNLVANALEHGSGQIRLEGTRAPGRLRIRVADEGAVAITRSGDRRARDPRRGHGTRLVAEVARRHGGRFVSHRAGDATVAVIELPLAR
jgi:signal transduction histidine kinase